MPPRKLSDVIEGQPKAPIEAPNDAAPEAVVESTPRKRAVLQQANDVIPEIPALPVPKRIIKMTGSCVREEY